MIPAPQADSGGRVPDGSFRWAANLEGQARVWDLEAWPQARPLSLRRSSSWDGASWYFHPRGDWLVVSTRTYRHLTFWPLSGSFPIVVDGHGTAIQDRHRPLAFSPDGRWLATVWTADSIRLWPMPGSGSRRVKTLILPQWNFWCELAFDPQARFLFVVGIADHAFIVPLDGSTPRRLERFSDDTLLVGAAVSPSGNRLVAGPTAGAGPRTLRVWDLESGKLRLLDLQEGSAGRKGIADIAFVDESTFYTAGWDGIRRWDLESGAHEIALPTRQGTAMGMALAPTGTTALVAETWLDSAGHFTMAGWSVKLLDLASGATRDLPALASPAGGWKWHVRPFALDASATVAATGDGEGTIRVARLAGGDSHLLLGHEGEIYYLAFSPDGRWIASTAADNTLRLWPMPRFEDPPLHTLPHAELVAKLRSLTNIRVVSDDESPEGWVVKLDPFPGWEKVPEW